jgi:hypothetical protein
VRAAAAAGFRNVTYRATVCPCCKESRLGAYPALVSPFLASYVFRTKAAATRLLECDACGLRFFEDRLTDAEAERLYSGYRGEDYFRARHRHEPWYTRKVNDELGRSDAVARSRRELVAGFLGRNTEVASIETVLDFGGDRGQMIPDGIGKERFVYEISGIPPVDGVRAIRSSADLEGKRFDLVLLSHVLEHCSEPKTVLEQVRPLLQRSSVLYVELPLDRVGLGWVPKSHAYGKYLAALARLPPALMAVDLYSTLVRLRYETVPPLGFVKMHEHINFFDERSLSRLLERCGFRTLALEKLVIRWDVGETPVLAALAVTA